MSSFLRPLSLRGGGADEVKDMESKSGLPSDSPVRAPGLFKSTIEEAGFLTQCWSQYQIMMRRNTILQYRYLGATVAQAIIAPFIFNILVSHH